MKSSLQKQNTEDLDWLQVQLLLQPSFTNSKAMNYSLRVQQVNHPNPNQSLAEVQANNMNI